MDFGFKSERECESTARHASQETLPLASQPSRTQEVCRVGGLSRKMIRAACQPQLRSSNREIGKSKLAHLRRICRPAVTATPPRHRGKVDPEGLVAMMTMLEGWRENARKDPLSARQVTTRRDAGKTTGGNARSSPEPCMVACRYS